MVELSKISKQLCSTNKKQTKKTQKNKKQQCFHQISSYVELLGIKNTIVEM